ncbi:hypothetical protein [Micromonospora okii]|uniref:hypothetical protein n=1 Tax=Micromonospora okii TaxID=1182970 RepID=UPI001E562F3F|nr:hypothetical protein [Micromonospora okii]
MPNQTFTTYDGLGRAVVVTSAKNGVTVSQTMNIYHGDRITTVPPSGGVVKTTVSDQLGRDKEIQEYHVRPMVTTPTDTFTGTFTLTGGTATVSG